MKVRCRCRLTVSLQKRLLEHFVAGTPARSAAELVGVNRNTATLYYRKLREIIAEQIAHEAPVSGEIEVNESYFGEFRKEILAGKAFDVHCVVDAMRAQGVCVVIPRAKTASTDIRSMDPCLRRAITSKTSSAGSRSSGASPCEARRMIDHVQP
ncbi:hypothetical protein [Komagataeibacter swingsii]|uniref:Transposase n=1 Tax=Komagataeibacter swingsii TaxID=215220 RepID=A0A850PAV3_9PROT|nr:hypothetical protein [Komagataeibacter swingsii]NVN38061.1 hypothetical protein [Komagataeibacter swingsii]